MKILKVLFDTAGPWDFVIFTGDLVQSGRVEEYEKLTEELNKLWEKFNRLGCKPLFLCIPGNHDLLRPNSDDPYLIALDQYHEKPKVRDLVWEGNDYLSFINNCFENFLKWYNNVNIPKPTKIVNGYIAGDFSTIIGKGKTNLGVIGFNTAFLQLTNGDYEGKLVIHEKQLIEVCNGDPTDWIQNNNISILLTHHSPKWFHKTSLENFQSGIYPPGRFYAHYCGHLHEVESINISEAGSEIRRLRQGTSIFGLETFGNIVKREHGYSSVRIEIMDDEGIEFIWPRKHTKLYGGYFKLVPDQGYELNEKNCLLNHFKLKSPDPKFEESINIDEELELGNKFENGSELESVEERSLIENKITKEQALNKLAGLLIKFTNEPHHKFIRLQEQANFEAFVRKFRHCWVAADWGLGRDGFLSCAIDRLKPEKQDLYIFRLKCEECENIEQIISSFSEQFRITLQEFCSYVAIIPNTVLIFDGVRSDLPGSGKNGGTNLQGLIKSIIDYCPLTYIILTSRRVPQFTFWKYIELKSLDLPDVRKYVENHKGYSENWNKEVFEKLFDYSDGLPMHLDRLIKELKFSNIEELLDFKLDGLKLDIQVEPIPQALIKAVSSLSNSQNQYSRRSYKLLKILTVLSSGETFNKIRRFNFNEPFYVENVEELERLSLIELVQLFEGQIVTSNKTIPELNNQKIIRVPRQVCDYIQSKISEEEYDDIIVRAAEILFGSHWRSGQIKKSSSNALSPDDLINKGPGNKQIVISHLIRKNLLKENSALALQATRLGIDNCYNLHENDRFKDTFNASKELLYLIEDSNFLKEKLELLILKGKAARMINKDDEAIESLQKALELNKDGALLSKNKKAHIHLNLVFIYFDANDIDKGMASANEVKKLSKESDSVFLQADSEIIEHTFEESDVERELLIIDAKAKKLGYDTLSSNINLSLAKKAGSYQKALEYYEKALNISSTSYNRVRAIVGKAKILMDEKKLDSFPPKEKTLLYLSYSYLYTQRFSSLFTRCHKVLWELFLEENQLIYLLRLFRYSSFMWRLIGEDDLEKEFVDKMNSLNFDFIPLIGKSENKLELNYYLLRKSEIIQNV